MPYGYWGKIARVDLTNNKVWEDNLDEEIYRKYLGGGALGGYYVLNNVPPGTDAFDPENQIVFAVSVVTGAPISGFGRHSVVSVSPLTGGICDTEAGGFWGAEFKFAGFDALVVEGKAEKPVYLLIEDGKVSIEDASEIWGGFLKEARDYIDKKHDKRHKILGIGPGGENLVRYACITADFRDANGRGGLGAVMGSKNLKAVAVSGGKKNINPADPDTVKEIAKKFNKTYTDYAHPKMLSALGTLGLINPHKDSGQLPSYNWRSGVIDNSEELSGEKVRDTIRHKMAGCFACTIKCKSLVKTEAPYEVDPEYTISEYESVSALGTYTGVTDLGVVAKAIELCNKHTMDTVSVGAAISFAMECFEEGILTTEDTGGLKLNFGNAGVIIPLIEMIARREGIGDLLAEGVKRAAQKLGKGSEKFAMHCKGMEFPAHEPRVKKGMALTYATCPIGADHMGAEQDPAVTKGAPQVHFDRLAAIDWRGTLDLEGLGDDKVRFNYLTQLLFSSYDCLDLCMFCTPPRRVLSFTDLIKAIDAVTGWETSLWEILRVGERRINMYRYFNCMSGFTAEDDTLPGRIFEPLKGGVSDGKVVNREDFEKALKNYYSLAGWDEDGVPTPAKLLELDLQWLIDKVK